MPPVMIQDLVLTLDTTSVEMQLTNSAIVPAYSDTDLNTFGGAFTDTTEKMALHLEGLQDYGALDALCTMLWTAALTDTLAFLLTIEGETWAGVVSPRKPSAGGAAGAALDFQIDLPVQGDVTYTAGGVARSVKGGETTGFRGEGETEADDDLEPADA